MRILAYLAGAFALVATTAFAQEPTVVTGDIQVIGDTFIDQIIEPVIQALSGLALAAITWLAVVFQRKTGLVIEAQRAEALHKALMTGVAAAVRRLGEGAPISKVAAEGVAYARQSVPDAINALRPSADVLTTLALSKLELLLVGTPKSDPVATFKET